MHSCTPLADNKPSAHQCFVLAGEQSRAQRFLTLAKLESRATDRCISSKALFGSLPPASISWLHPEDHPMWSEGAARLGDGYRECGIIQAVPVRLEQPPDWSEAVNVAAFRGVPVILIMLEGARVSSQPRPSKSLAVSWFSVK